VLFGTGHALVENVRKQLCGFIALRFFRFDLKLIMHSSLYLVCAHYMQHRRLNIDTVSLVGWHIHLLW